MSAPPPPPAGVGCPPPAALRRFQAGTLPEADGEAVAAHLDACPACAAAVDQLDDAPDSVAAALRNLPSTIEAVANTPARPVNGSSPAPDVPGHELLGEVGRGGMGVVYRARQHRLNRTVALKMVLAGRYARAEELVRFQLEGETLARLSHPGIVRIYETGQADGRPFFSMEWVGGGTLADKLLGRPWPAADAAELVGQLARAVQYAHDQGVIHRDLKPANVLLGDGVAKITDFGLAKLAAAETGLTVTGTVVGTPGYMAPEQARGERHVGPAADVYSLGAILYELATGRPPFPLPADAPVSPVVIVQQVVEREPAAPRRLNPRVPRDLATVALKCLEKEPGRRYPSAGALADDLQRFRAGRPVFARRTGEVERVWKWSRRRPVLALLIASLLASLAGGAAVSTGFALESRRARRQAEEAEDGARRHLARADVREGLRLAEAGRVGDGLHRLLAGLRDAPAGPADDPFRELVRWNLHAWGERLHALRVVVPHPDEVYALAFSPDGRLIVCGGHAGTVQVYAADTGEAVGPPLAAGCEVRAVAFTADGRSVLAGGLPDRTRFGPARVGRWEVGTGKVLVAPVVPPGEHAVSLAASPDRVFVGSRGRAWVCDAVTGAVVERVAAPDPLALVRPALAADGGGFVTTAGNVAAVVRDGSPAWAELPGGVTHWAGLTADGRGLSGRPDGLRPFDLFAPAAVGPVQRLADIDCVSLAPGGRFAAVATATELVVWDAAAGVVHSAVAGAGRCHAVAFSPDGRRLAAASYGGTLRVWDVAPLTPRPLAPGEASSRPAPPPFASAQFSGDMSAVARAGTGGRAAVWTPAGDRPLPGRDELPTGHGHQVGLTPDGRRAVLADPHDAKLVRLWDVAAGRPVGAGLRLREGLSALAVDPTGRLAATGDYAREVRLLDAVTGEPVGQPLPHRDVPHSLAFSPDGRTLAVSLLGDNRRAYAVRLWDAATGEPLGDSLPAGGTEPVAVGFRPDSAVLATTTADGVRVWDARTGRAAGPPLPLAGGTTAVAYSPAGDRLAAGGRAGLVRVWDAATGRPAGDPLPGAGRVRVLAFHPAGRLLAVGYDSGVVRVWDTATGLPVGPPVAQPGPPLAVGFPPAGGFLRTVAGDGAVRDWPLPESRTESVEELAADLLARTGDQLSESRVLAPADPEAWRAAVRRPDPPPADPDRGPSRDAEQAGDWATAGWHLDRLLARHPGEWELHARRGRARAAAGRPGEAVADLDRAAARDADALAGWAELRAADARSAGEWPLARWHLDRLPATWRTRAARAEVFDKLGQPESADADRAEAVRLGAGEPYRLWLADRRVRQKRWAEAAELVRDAATANPQLAAVALLSAGDRDGFRRLCRRLADGLAGRSPVDVNNAVAAVVTGPGGLDDYADLIARQTAATAALTSPGGKHAFLNTLGSVQVRAGRHRDAVASLTAGLEAVGGVGEPHDWLMLALAHHHLGEADRAAEWLAHMDGWAGGRGYLVDREVELLRVEVGALVGKPAGPKP